jgi:hypothetical protein
MYYAVESTISVENVIIRSPRHLCNKTLQILNVQKMDRLCRKPVKVTDNKKDTSFQYIIYITNL